jgi:hypothetical protein
MHSEETDIKDPSAALRRCTIDSPSKLSSARSTILCIPLSGDDANTSACYTTLYKKRPAGVVAIGTQLPEFRLLCTIVGFLQCRHVEFHHRHHSAHDSLYLFRVLVRYELRARDFLILSTVFTAGRRGKEQVSGGKIVFLGKRCAKGRGKITLPATG